MTDNMQGAMRMMAAMALFTFNDVCMKSVADELPLFQAIFMRSAVATLGLALLAMYMGVFRFDFRRKDWGLIALRTVAEGAAAYFFISALFNMPIANITAILQALPLTVSLAGAVFLGEAIGWRRLSAILVGFVGVLLIVKPGADDFSIYSIYAVLTVVVVTVRDLASRRLSPDVPSIPVAAISALFVTAMAGVFSLSEVWVVPSALAVGQLSLAVVFILCAYIMSVAAMRVGDIGTIAPFRYTGLLWALFLGSIFSSLHILASGLMRIATSTNSLSKNGTRASTPQAAIDLLARKQSKHHTCLLL